MSIRRSDETQIVLFDRSAACHIWNIKGAAHDRKNSIPTVKHGGGSIMVWACFSNGTDPIKEERFNRKTHSLLNMAESLIL